MPARSDLAYFYMIAFRTMMVWFLPALTIVAVSLVPVFAQSATLRLAASTPLSSYADPLAIDTGNGIIPAVFDGGQYGGSNVIQ